jgi:hypothetical protein
MVKGNGNKWKAGLPGQASDYFTRMVSDTVSL